LSAAFHSKTLLRLVALGVLRREVDRLGAEDEAHAVHLVAGEDLPDAAHGGEERLARQAAGARPVRRDDAVAFGNLPSISFVQSVSRSIRLKRALLASIETSTCRSATSISRATEARR
jgi:hypothetical protein